MAESAHLSPLIECGFCLRTNNDIEEPRVLPCTHVHCLQCLNASFERRSVVRCPLTTCGKTFDVTIDSLEPYTDSTVGSVWCDICLSKKKTKQPAVCYCSTCNKKYCNKHAEFHEEMNEEHSVINMDTYRTQAKKLEIRLCPIHKDKPYNAGCKVCHKIICVDCLPSLGSCTAGAVHELFPLNHLTAFFLEEIDKLKSEMLVKECVLEKLFKTTSKAISDYDDKTREMLELIRKTRDEQLTCIKNKYIQLEKEVIEQRENSKLGMEDFKEGKVGEKWSDIRNRRLRFGAKIEHSHQCDIVSGYGEIVAEAQKIIDEELPSLELDNVVSLIDKDKSRDIELDMVSEQVHIESEQGLTTSPTLIQSLTLHSQVPLAYPVSVSQCQGQTYVATDNRTVCTVNPANQSPAEFLSLEGYPTDSVVYKERVYTLIRSPPFCLKVHDLTGRYLTEWTYTDEGDYSKLVIVNDQVIIPDRPNSCLVVYSLSGEKIKQIPLVHMSTGWLALCTRGDNCVVVSDYGSSRVFKVKVTSGEVLWTCTDIANPLGVTCYKKLLLVAGCSSSPATINVLDYRTGAVLKVITDDALVNWDYRQALIFDLDIINDTLIVPNYYSSSVLYYRLIA